MTMHTKTIGIGGASSYWGESATAIIACAKAKDANAGLATGFIPAVPTPNRKEIARQSVKITAKALT